MLEHYKTFANAKANGYLNLIRIFPSELQKTVAKNNNVLRITLSKEGEPKAFTIKVVMPGFNLHSLEHLHSLVIDSYEDSEDVMPSLPKPVATEPPRTVEIRQELITKAAELKTDWSSIPDE